MLSPVGRRPNHPSHGKAKLSIETHGNLLKPYRMGPPRWPSCLISGLTMVYGRYNYSQCGLQGYINQLITGGAHPVVLKPIETYGNLGIPLLRTPPFLFPKIFRESMVKSHESQDHLRIMLGDVVHVLVALWKKVQGVNQHHRSGF